jgi:hypothetical protein
MNAAQVILVWLGHEVVESSRPNRWKLMKDGKQFLSWSLTAEELERACQIAIHARYGSVHAAAEKAAEWWNTVLLGKVKHTWAVKFHEGYWVNWDVRYNTPFGVGRPLSDLELIAEAVGAGWEG